MKKLIALTQIITQKKVNQINIVINNAEQTILGKFYKGIAEGEIKTIEDAENYLYGKPTDRALMNKLKDNLYNRLINTVFFIDIRQSNFTDYGRAYHSINKLYAAYILLSNRSLDKVNTIEIGENLVNKSKKYDFSDIIVGAGNILSSTYSLSGDFKKLQAIQKTVSHYLDIIQIESNAQHAFNSIICEYVSKRGANSELSQKSAINLKKFYSDFQKYQTYKLGYFIFSFKMFMYGFISDYENTLSVCEEGIRFFDKKGKNCHLVLGFYQQKLECCIHFGLYTEGVALKPKIESLLGNGNHNWFRNQELLIKLCFHSGQYEEAYSIFTETIEHPKFKKLLPHFQEFWKVCEVYIYTCVTLGLIKNVHAEEKKKRFRLSSFANSVPLFSYDKRGMNIPIIIAQILYFLAKRELDIVNERIGSIEKYCVRHLVDKDFDARSYYFIKMLLTLPDADFNLKRVKVRAQGFKDKFDAAPTNSKNIEIEIMPYEKLWDLLLDVINPKLRNQNRKQVS